MSGPDMTQTSGTDNHARPKSLEFDDHIIPKSLQSSRLPDISNLGLIFKKLSLQHKST